MLHKLLSHLAVGFSYEKVDPHPKKPEQKPLTSVHQKIVTQIEIMTCL